MALARAEVHAARALVHAEPGDDPRLRRQRRRAGRPRRGRGGEARAGRGRGLHQRDRARAPHDVTKEVVVRATFDERTLHIEVLDTGPASTRTPARRRRRARPRTPVGRPGHDRDAIADGRGVVRDRAGRRQPPAPGEAPRQVTPRAVTVPLSPHAPPASKRCSNRPSCCTPRSSSTTCSSTCCAR
jgi:hypothetical protein